MKLLCWNIRGFGLTGRRRQLIEYLRQEEIDIVGLQETIRQDLVCMSSRGFPATSLPGSGCLLWGNLGYSARSQGRCLLGGGYGSREILPEHVRH